MENQLPFPYEFEDVPEHLKELSKKLDTDDTGSGVVMLKGTKISCYPRIKEHGIHIYNFKPRPDDIWVMGFPRSGTTMTQEIVYLLGTDLNYEKAASQFLDYRFPYIENCLVLRRNNSMPLYPYEWLEKTNEKRFIKSHFGFRILHPDLLKIGCKIVYIARNPKDAINSLAHFPSLKTLPGYNVQIFWDMFLNNLLGYGNYFDILECAWRNRGNRNLLFLFYEDIINDKKQSVMKIAEFMDKKLTNEQLNALLNHIDFKNFKNNKSVNNDRLVDEGQFVKTEDYAFIRRGKVGSWKEEIPKELIEKVNVFVRENLKAIPDFDIPECWKDILEI